MDSGESRGGRDDDGDDPDPSGAPVSRDRQQLPPYDDAEERRRAESARVVHSSAGGLRQPTPDRLPEEPITEFDPPPRSKPEPVASASPRNGVSRHPAELPEEPITEFDPPSVRKAEPVAGASTAPDHLPEGVVTSGPSVRVEVAPDAGQAAPIDRPTPDPGPEPA